MPLDRKIPSAAPLAVTMGDPAGIGGEIILRAWRETTAIVSGKRARPFFVIDDKDRLERLARHLGWTVPLVAIDAPEAAAAAFLRGLPVLHRPFGAHPQPGRPSSDVAAATIASIEEAVTLVRAGRAAAVVTNPIAKSVLAEAGFGFPGHTEFLAALATGSGEDAPHPVMMLTSERLTGGAFRVVPLTVHVPLSAVPGLVDGPLIERTARIVARALARDFAIAAPRLALSGLNPHASEQGRIGREDIDILGPAAEKLRAEGIALQGPLPGDTLFHAEARRGYDAVLCPYHDQALIPLKTLDFHGGVNVTLGLPFIRTSPDHGTAFGIAGQGKADPSSLLEALALADRLATARGADRNPLAA